MRLTDEDRRARGQRALRASEAARRKGEDRRRRVLALVDEGRTPAEIADILGVSRGAVHNLVSRARKANLGSVEDKTGSDQAD